MSVKKNLPRCTETRKVLIYCTALKKIIFKTTHIKSDKDNDSGTIQEKESEDKESTEYFSY